MTLQNNAKARLLARLMSDLSEDHWCTGWLSHCEYALWGDLTGEEVPGHKGWGLSEEEIEELRVAHELAEGWIMWSNEQGEKVYLPTKEWLAHLASMGNASLK